MTRSSSKIDGWTSVHCDGTPGVELYLAPWAFTWSGRAADPIEVAHGGYGEAVEYLIDLRSWARGQLAGWSLWRTLGWFNKVCQEFDTWVGGDPDVEDAQIVEFDLVSSASTQHFIETGVHMLHAAPQEVLDRLLK